jgi:CDP-4-dehydro-6-deoxyglucose reductase
MPPQKYNVKILDVSDLTSNVKEFTIEKPEGSDHLPGQFMTIKICDDNPQVCMRSYSVLSTPDKKNLQLCIKAVEGGRGSNWIFQQPVGTELDIIYPAGKFVLPDELVDELVFIGTGTGLVPLLCMLESFLEGFDKNVKLIFGVRFKEDFYYLDRLEELKKRIPKFELITTVSRPDDEWKGHKGRVTGHMENLNVNAQYFICGSGAVIKDVCEHLEEGGVPEKNVFHENFG